MTIPSSGAVGLDLIQTEFGGTNPIGINEYYRGAGYTTQNNLGVPANGVIGINNFLSAYRTANAAELVTALKNTTYANVRNMLISTTSFGVGLETSTLLTFNASSSATYRYTTTLTKAYTWPTTFNTSFEPVLRAGYLTFIMRNVGTAPLTNSITVNGVSKTLTDITNSVVGPLTVRMSYVSVPMSYAAIAGLSVTTVYTKASDNRENLQELFILPGKWNLKSSGASTAISFSLGTVAANDIAFAVVTNGLDGYYDTGSWGGSAARTQILRRNSKWYYNTSSLITTCDTAGSLNFTPGSITTQLGTSPGNYTYTTDYWSAFGCVFTFTGV